MTNWEYPLPVFLDEMDEFLENITKIDNRRSEKPLFLYLKLFFNSLFKLVSKLNP